MNQRETSARPATVSHAWDAGRAELVRSSRPDMWGVARVYVVGRPMCQASSTPGPITELL